MRLQHKFLKNEEGGVLIFMGFAIVVLIVAVGVAIDAGRVFLVNSKAQTALDAAVVSAAAVSFQPVDASERAQLNALIQQRGSDFFAANYPNGYMGVNIGPGNATFTTVDADGTRLRGDLSITVPTFFGDVTQRLVGSGNPTVGMDEFAEVERVIPDIDIEISLALDHTKSMCDPSCNAKFGVMRESVNILIDTLESSLQATSGGSTIHYAFIPFTHTVKNNNVVSNLSESYLRYATGSNAVYNATVGSLPNMRGLSRNITQIKNSLQNIEPVTNSISGTNVGTGAYWGWLALRNASRNDFRGISRATKPGGPAPMKTANNNENTYKMLLLLTDGENSSWYFSPTRTPAWYERNDPIANAAQAAACAGAKREGIEVRVIPVQVTDPTALGLLRGCASLDDNNQPFYYPVSDPQELRAVFREIANDLIDLRIRK